MSSIPIQEAGVASGTNSAIRELGGVVGVAVLASVFVQHGDYTNPHAFMHGSTPAVWVAAGLSMIVDRRRNARRWTARQPKQNSPVAVALLDAQAA